MKDRIAGVIRKMTVPPVLALAMLLIFRIVYGDRFITAPLLALEIILLVLVPAGAYLLPRLGKAGERSREKERKLAFLMNLIGYGLAFLAGILCRCSGMLLMILAGYLLAVTLLTVLNKAVKVRASGHACSCTLPYLFFWDFLGLGAGAVCVLLYLAEFWASVRLKRHTVKEFLPGSAVAVFTFAVVRLSVL